MCSKLIAKTPEFLYNTRMVSIQKDVSLKDFSNYKIGGPAKYFLEVSNLDELIEGFIQWEKISKALPIFVLGAGTNLLIGDRGFGGLVIHNKIKDIKILSEKDTKSQRIKESKSQRIRVGAGVLMEDLLNFCVQNCLSGLEWAGGLPGTVGGAVRGNAGAFGGEIKDGVYQVESVSTYEVSEAAASQVRKQVRKRKNSECKFRYRSSIFKDGEGKNEIIISVELKLQKGDKDLITKQIEEKIEYRKNRHPLEYPNIGSIFKNIFIEKVPQKLLEQLKDSIKDDPFPILPTAKLLAVAGLKGKKVGGAMVSQKHPNFIVNLDNATFRDVLDLIREVKSLIYKKYQIELEEEITVF